MIEIQVFRHQSVIPTTLNLMGITMAIKLLVLHPPLPSESLHQFLEPRHRDFAPIVTRALMRPKSDVGGYSLTCTWFWYEVQVLPQQTGKTTSLWRELWGHAHACHVEWGENLSLTFARNLERLYCLNLKISRCWNWGAQPQPWKKLQTSTLKYVDKVCCQGFANISRLYILWQSKANVCRRVSLWI